MNNQPNQFYGYQNQYNQKRCSNCGATIESGQAFCSSCGAPAPKNEPPKAEPPTTSPNKCSMCGSEVQNGAAFCSVCGNKISVTASTVNQSYGSNSNYNSNYNPSYTPNANYTPNTDYNPNSNYNPNPNYNSNPNTNYNPSYNSNPNSSYTPNYTSNSNPNSNPNPNYNSSYSQDFNQGYNSNSNYNQNYTPNYNSNYNSSPEQNPYTNTASSPYTQPVVTKKKKKNKDNKKKKGLKLAIILIIAAVALLLVLCLIPVLSTSTEDLLEEGNYEKAYEKADSDSEKEEIADENLVAYISQMCVDSLKKGETFELKSAHIFRVDKNSKYYDEIKTYIDHDLYAIVLKATITDKDEDSETYYWTFFYDSDEKDYVMDNKTTDNIMNDLGDMEDYFTITELPSKRIKNINKLYEDNKLEDVELLDVNK